MWWNAFGACLTCVDHYASGEMFHLCRCRDCGFLFTQDFPWRLKSVVTTKLLITFHIPIPARGDELRVPLGAQLYAGTQGTSCVREAHRKEGRLLDLGTGTGYFADAMQRRGWQVEAVEKSAQARAFAKEHFNLDVETPYGI